MFGIKRQLSGRVLLLRCEGPLNGEEISPEQILVTIRTRGIRFLLLDATHAPFIDSDGLRWLMRLRARLAETGSTLRIAARPQGKVWRNLRLLNIDLELYESAARAWKTPWRVGRAH